MHTFKEKCLLEMQDLNDKIKSRTLFTPIYWLLLFYLKRKYVCLHNRQSEREIEIYCVN